MCNVHPYAKRWNNDDDYYIGRGSMAGDAALKLQNVVKQRNTIEH